MSPLWHQKAPQAHNPNTALICSYQILYYLSNTTETISPTIGAGNYISLNSLTIPPSLTAAEQEHNSIRNSSRRKQFSPQYHLCHSIRSCLVFFSQCFSSLSPYTLIPITSKNYWSLLWTSASFQLSGWPELVGVMVSVENCPRPAGYRSNGKFGGPLSDGL